MPYSEGPSLEAPLAAHAHDAELRVNDPRVTGAPILAAYAVKVQSGNRLHLVARVPRCSVPLCDSEPSLHVWRWVIAEGAEVPRFLWVTPWCAVGGAPPHRVALDTRSGAELVALELFEKAHEEREETEHRRRGRARRIELEDIAAPEEAELLRTEDEIRRGGVTQEEASREIASWASAIAEREARADAEDMNTENDTEESAA